MVRNIDIDRNVVASLTIDSFTVNDLAGVINVVNNLLLIVSCVGNINGGISSIRSYVNFSDVGYRRCVAVNCRNINCNPAVVTILRPIGVGNLVIY